MARSVDGLIRHLLDQISLCGEHGALPSDFNGYVESYYAESIQDVQNINGENGVSSHTKLIPNIDRPFLEQIWKWISGNSEIRVGNHVGHMHLTFSEVEERNTAIQRLQQEYAVSPDTENGDAGPAFQGSHEPVDNCLGQAALIAETIVSAGEEATEQSGYAIFKTTDATNPIGLPQEPNSSAANNGNDHGANVKETSEASGTPARITAASAKPEPDHTIRLYTSTSRMWHALTGHGLDFVKVKPLDFDCLSIIARFGSQGILQHDLTRLAGQDKRSLPSRTDRLYEGGYIIKEHLAVKEGIPPKMLHTSRCVLKRFAYLETDPTLQPYPTQVDASSAKKKKKGSRVKGRKNQKAAQSDPPATNDSVVSEPRPVPQWTADRSISNQIFYLVNQSGIKGMSMSDIRDHLFGSNVKKITEDYVSRLVESWQISQPLHLRHLSIVRDTVLKGKSQIYVYYTFENFQRLVDEGRGFWEAVTTVADDVREGNNIAAALDAQADLDEYGFPKLDANQFQGRHHGTTLGDVASALDVAPMPIGRKDPILRQSADGTYAVKYQKAQTRTTAHSDDRWHSVLASSPSRPILPKPQAVETPKQKKAPGPGRPVSVIPQGPAEPKRPLSTPLPVEFPLYQTPIPKRKYVRKNAKPLGRPRKYPKTGIPENIESMSAKDIEQMRDSQEMAEKYEVIQMGDEIMKRIEDEEDPILVTDQVLAAANDLRSWEGEDSLPEASIAQILFDFAGGPRPDPASTSGTDWISKLPPAYQPSKTLGRHPRERPYWPSMAAHIYPSHVNRRRPAVILEPFPEKRVDEGEILANRTRRRRAPVGDLRTLTDRKPVPDPTPVVKHVMQYLPSVAAHSQPNLGARSTNTSVPQDKVPRRRGRPPQQREPALPQSPTVTGLKRKRAAKQPIAQHAVSTVPGVLPQYKYLPSIAAHSGSFLPPYVSLSAEVGVKRRRGPNKLKPIARDVESAAPGFLTQYKYLPSIAAHSGSFLPPCVLNSTERGLKRKGVPDFVPSGIDEGAYPGWVQFMSKIYEPQLRNVARPHGGIFLGKTMLRRKRPCEPKGFRPRVFKLVVFKSARLKEFDWFVPETAPSKSTPQRSRSQSLALPAAESINYIRSAPKGTPNLSQLIPLTSISEALMAVRPESSNLSSSAGGNDTKRKRGQSPQPTRGIPPPAPFFRGSTPRMGTSTVTEKPNIPLDLGNAPKGTPSPALSSRRSPPNIKSFTVVEKPKTSLNSRSAPPALGKADSDTTSEDEGPRRTPETPKDMSPCVGEPIVAVSNGQASNKDDPPPQTLKSLVIASQSMAPPGQASEKDDVSPRTSKLHDAALQGMVPPEQVSNEHNAFPQTSKSLVTTLQATAPPTRRSFGPTKKSFGHMSRQGGSSAILRKNVIMDLVEKCGGVFPNHREMSKPFAIEWHKKGQEGYPEPKTLQNAVTALCSENRIRRITFTAQTSQGLNVTKDMIALASIDNADLRVKELQTKIVAAHPRLYLPEAVTPPKDPKCVDAQGSIVWNGDAQDSDGSESADIPHSKVTKRKRRRRNSRGELVNIPSVPEKPSPITTRRARFVPSKLHSRRTGNTSGSIGKILRLATLQNSISAPTSRLPPTPTSGIPSNGIESLTWLSSEYAFSETNFEEERPTILEPANMEGTHRRYARYGTQMDPPQAKRSKDPQEQVKKRMRKMAENAAQIERHQAEVKATRPSLLYSDFGSSSKLSSKIGKLKSSFPSAITVSRRGSMSSERTTPSLSPSAPKVVLNWQPSAFEEAQESTTYRRSFLVGFMDPVHYFYKATGTFSVTFVGLQPPRKIIAHRGTCMYPYKADLKVVDPLVGRKYNAILGPAGRHYYVQPLQERFVEEVDSLLSWELSTEGVQDTVVKGWPIINYDFPHSLTTPETIAADQEAARGLTVCFKDGGSFTTPLRKGRPRGGRRPSSGRRKVPRAEAGTLDSEPKTPLKHRRLLSVAQKKVEDEIVEPDSRPTKYRRLRGPRSAKYLSEEDEQRLLTAVILVRTLTGGIEQHIDWVLVAKVFENEFDQIFVHSRWGYVRNKYTLVLPKMESNFQDLFAQAYEDGTVPKIEFDNLEAYDWKWLVEWVMAKIDTAFQSQPELPAERDEFQDLYTMEEISEIDITDFYEFDRVFNTKKRILVISRSAYVYPLQQGRQSQASEEAEQLSTARSWVRANIITPQETYDPAAARATLSIFSENVIEDALKQLLVDKVLMQQNRGRLVPGRNYDVSTFFLDRLKRKILSAHFQRAIAFKRKLDHDFAEKGSHPYSYTADDGDVLAVFNLMANKRITAVPIDVPLNKWGLTDGGYESRLMNKNRLKTGVELRPLPDYVAGNLLGPYPPPPSQHLQDPNARIPLWYDIHGALVPVMWEMVLSAVLSVLAMRPGAGAVEIEKASKPAMEAWEIESALQWLVDARITKKEATGYTVEEWWWLALGVMEDLVESGANTRIEKGKSKATDAAEDGMVMELDE